MQFSPHPSMPRPHFHPLQSGVFAVGLLITSSTACATDPGNDAGNLDAGASEGDEERSSESIRASKVDRLDEHKPLGTTTFHDECAETRGDRCDDCESRARQSEAECWSACRDAVTYGGPVVSCVGLCGEISSSGTCSSICEGEPSTCAARGYRFDVVAQQLPVVLDACRSAVARDVSCDETTVGAECELYARVERQATAAAYLCVSALECGADALPCFSPLGESTLGEDVAAWCTEEKLNQNTLAALKGQGRWVRSEVQHDLHVCQQLCGTGDFEACVTAWLEATIGTEI
jgi:hypothetical protein